MKRKLFRGGRTGSKIKKRDTSLFGVGGKRSK